MKLFITIILGVLIVLIAAAVINAVRIKAKPDGRKSAENEIP